MERWSVRWAWVERAAAWDDEKDWIKHQGQLKEIESMGVRYAGQAQLIAQALMHPVNTFLTRLRDMQAARASR
jgi:hypothetical protein